MCSLLKEICIETSVGVSGLLFFGFRFGRCFPIAVLKNVEVKLEFDLVFAASF